MEVKPGYKQTEVGVIPEDWETHAIGDSMRLVNGRAFKPKDWKDSGLPIIRIQNLNDTESAFNYCSGLVEDRHRIEAGDLLFAWSGTTGTSFGARVWNGPTGVLNQHIFKVLPDQTKLTLPYALLVLRKIQEHIEKQAHGFKASFVHVKKSDLVGIQLPLPPTKVEQEAIAEALSDADALIESLEQLLAKKRLLKQGAMQELLTGKKRLPGLGNEQSEFKETAVGRLPMEWPVVEVRQVTRSHKQGYYTKDRYVDAGVKLVRITDLLNPRIEYATMPMLRLSASDHDLYRVHVGDFLFARSGAIGRYGIVYEDVDAVFGSYIIRFTFDSASLKNEYFGYLYETEIVWKQLLSITQGSSNININASNIKSILIPLPHIDEQTAIATILSDMDAEITALETKLSKARQIKQGMMQELLTGRIRLI